MVQITECGALCDSSTVYIYCFVCGFFDIQDTEGKHIYIFFKYIVGL